MSIFSKIITGEIPCYKLKEDENFISFLDIMPVAMGHTLVVPKKEIDVFFDLEDDLLSKYLAFAKPIAESLKKTFDCNRIGLSVIGLEVAHAHLHLIPISKLEDMDFKKERLKFSKEEFTEMQNNILKNFS